MTSDKMIFTKNILFMLKLFTDNVVDNFPQLKPPAAAPGGYPVLAPIAKDPIVGG